MSDVGQHEPTHYFERNHGTAFAVLMDERLPDWRRRRTHLGHVPLRSEEWPAHPSSDQ
ncbi:DUF45 domain-containing protein [Pseudactinotalea sp. HY160]|uniref:YgjP-like metallopeptidase domain-containing protein n=1 Tax=Pseudactinotalea sp. HY160 TaxID=2654490 RepID=UPI00128E49A2|nr:YgjP-like metallopeptidase domain-containing protein [Pseudactinotalea sp. HY160]MPV48648.1 DUF45 domain-containing protein [Pseudactinotalea sp. HY160]